MRRLKVTIEVPYSGASDVEEIVEIGDDEDVDAVGADVLETLYSNTFPGCWYLVDEDGNEVDADAEKGGEG